MSDDVRYPGMNLVWPVVERVVVTCVTVEVTSTGVSGNRGSGPVYPLVITSCIVRLGWLQL